MSAPSNTGSRYALTSRYPNSLNSIFRGPFILNFADGDGAGDGGKAAEAADKKDGGDDGKKAEAAKAEEGKKHSAEERIQAILKEKKDLETKLAEKEAADKKRAEEELAKKGEHEKLAKQYGDERDKALNDAKTAAEQAKAYEEVALAQIKQSVEGIQDEEKRKTAEKLLEGLPTLDQYKRLPEILKLVGQSANGFGGPNLGGGGPALGSKEQKEARLRELSSKRDRTPKEEKEMNTLMAERLDWGEKE